MTGPADIGDEVLRALGRTAFPALSGPLPSPSLGGWGGTLAGPIIGRAIADAARSLGPMPIGDPSAMRAAAEHLLSRAHRIRDAVERAAAMVDRTVWNGPRADRFRHASRDDIRELRAAVQDLEEAARRLLRDADSIEAAQHVWARRRDGLIHDAVTRVVNDTQNALRHVLRPGG